MKLEKRLNEYSEDPEVVRNRKDKSLLVVYTLKPELIMEPSVAFPDEVVHLVIFSDTLESGIARGNITLYYEWDSSAYEDTIYTRTLYKDLVNFHNLKYFSADSLKLEMDLWKEWANNCTQLKEIYFGNTWSDTDYFKFDEETLETIFKIPTLEKVSIYCIELPFFPVGPSNIKDLRIMAKAYDREFEDEETEYDSDSDSNVYCEGGPTAKAITSYSNLCTHTNLKILYIEKFTKFFMRPEPLLNVAKHCVNLEELSLGFIEGDAPNVLEKLFQLPKLKKCTLIISSRHDGYYDKLINDQTLSFPSITHLNLINEEGKGLTNEDMIWVLNPFPNLEICNFSSGKNKSQIRRCR